MTTPHLNSKPAPSNLLALALALIVAMASACGGFGSPSRAPAKTSGNGSSYVTSSDSHRGAVPSEASSESAYGDSEADYSPQQSARDRPGLGTSFGERRSSSVRKREFVRARQTPFAQVALHYNSREGIEAQSFYRGMRIEELRAQTDHGGLSVSLIDESGRLLQGGSGNGRTYVIGQDGQRYMLQIRNDTGGTYEVVSSVDGLDVIDGTPAHTAKRGYIIEPYSTLTIDGFRTDMESVAAFRFGAVQDSYAARTSGDRNVGVIGIAFFAERGSRWTSDEVQARESANPFPGDFARPPSIVR